MLLNDGTDFRLNPATKKAWVKNLRSGDFAQGSLSLCTVSQATKEKRYCCLGVLGEQKRILRFDRTAHAHYVIGGEDEGTMYGYLPNAFIPEAVQTTLSQMNDHERRTFPEIADWIEENL